MKSTPTILIILGLAILILVPLNTLWRGSANIYADTERKQHITQLLDGLPRTELVRIFEMPADEPNPRQWLEARLWMPESAPLHRYLNATLIGSLAIGVSLLALGVIEHAIRMRRRLTATAPTTTG